MSPKGVAADILIALLTQELECDYLWVKTMHWSELTYAMKRLRNWKQCYYVTVVDWCKKLESKGLVETSCEKGNRGKQFSFDFAGLTDAGRDKAKLLLVMRKLEE